MHQHLFSNALVATALALALLMGGPAIAGCKPQTLITSIDTVPVKDDLAMVVPTTVKGAKVDMLLDTGGYFSELTARPFTTSSSAPVIPG